MRSLEERLDQVLHACPFPEHPSLIKLLEIILQHEHSHAHVARLTPISLVLFEKEDDKRSRDFIDVVAKLLFGSSNTLANKKIDLIEEIEQRKQLQKKEEKRSFTTSLYHSLQEKMFHHVLQFPDRSIIVLKNIQAVNESSIPVLDVLLQPLQGQTRHPHSGEVIDYKNTIFFLLMNNAEKQPIIFDDFNDEAGEVDWREYLEQLWAFKGPEFTPSALIGRLTDGIVVEGNEKLIHVNQTCLQDHFGTLLDSIHTPSTNHHSIPIIFSIAILLVVWLMMLKQPLRQERGATRANTMSRRSFRQSNEETTNGDEAQPSRSKSKPRSNRRRSMRRKSNVPR